MAFKLSAALVLFSLAFSTIAAPAPSSQNSTSTSSSVLPSSTVKLASDDPNDPLWNFKTDIDPQPIRGKTGGTILGPQNVEIDRQNPDLLASPSTDSGTV